MNIDLCLNLNNYRTRVVIDYTNYRGERKEYTVIIEKFWFGISEYHKSEGPAMFMRARDVNRNGDFRDFLIKDIHTVTAVC